MADNLTLNAGSGGSTLATDDVGGIHYQRVKLVDGTLDSTTAIASGNGLAAGALRVTIASDTTGVVAITDNSGSITVDNGGTFAVQAAQSGTWTVTGAGGTFPVTDSAGSLTVDAPVGTPVFVRLSDGASAISTLPVSLTSTTITGTVAATQSGTWTVTGAGGTFPITDSGGSITVDNAGTFAVQAAITAASGSIASGAIASGAIASGAIASGAIAAGAIAAGATSIAANEDDASADLDRGVKILAVRKATPANTSGTDGDYEFLQLSAGRLWTSATIDTALPAGTNAIGKLASNTGVTIGAVEIAASQTLSTVTTVSTVTTCSTLTGGGVAHDGVDSGNPHKIGAKATAALSTITKVAAADRTDLYAGVDGVQITRPHCNLEDIVTGNATNTDGTSTQCIAAQTGSIKTYLTSVILCNTSASNITVDIKDGTTIKVSLPLPANSGCIFNPPVPIPGTAATAWNFDPSAAASTVTCSMVGFKSLV